MSPKTASNPIKRLVFFVIAYLVLSILLIAHDLAVVKNVCDRVCVMQRGLFVDAGTSEEVFERPKSDYTKRLLAAVPDVSRALRQRCPQMQS